MFINKYTSTLLALIVSANANAIVSMESIHTGAPKEGFSGQLELSINGSSGNTDKQEYSLGARAQWHEDTITNYLIASGSYGESNDVKNSDKSFIHARHMRERSSLLTLEGFAQAEQNEFARLEYRGLLGGGARLTLLPRAEKGEAYLGLGAFFSKERIDDSYADGGTESLWRANTYLVLKYQVSDNTSLLSTTYYQPALEETDDYRLTEQAAMKVKLNETLSLLISLDYRYDSLPPTGVEKDDVSYKTSLSWEF